MPQVNQIQNLLLANAPPNVRAQAQAGEDAMQRAAAPSAPYTSRTAGLLKALQGGLGGLMEGGAIHQAMQGRQAAATAGYGWLNSLQPGPGSPGSTASMTPPSAMPIPGSAPTMPKGALPIGDAGSRDLAIRTIYGEAGGEPPQGQAGVAAVLKNRLAGGQYGNDMQSVIMAPKQFSLWNAGDPAGASASRLDPSSPAYQRIGQIYDGIMSGQIPDPTGGATHYYNPHVAHPAWGPQLAQQNDVTIGNHRFVGAGPAGPNGGDPGINLAARGPTTAAPGINADVPATNVHNVSSDALPPGITPGMISAPPASDGTVRGDLMAAVAQHGGLDPDAPVPNAQPVSMAGLPPGVTPAMFAASQGPGPDLHRQDEVPASGSSGPAMQSGVPHQLAPGADARADSGVGVGTGGIISTPGRAAGTTIDAGSGPELDPEGTAAQNYDPNAGPSLRDTLEAAFKGPDLGVTQPAVVPDPVSASAPDAPAAPSILPPGRPPSGDVAGPASVPAPQGSLTAPPAPQSDGSVRGDLLSAWAQHDPVGAAQAQGRDVALDPVVPDPTGTLMPPAPSSPNGALAGPQSDAAAGGAGLGFGGSAAQPQVALPDSTPLPPPGAQSLQAPADVASAAAAAGGPELDPEGTGPANYPADGGPSLRDTLEAAFKGSPAPATPGQVGTDQAAGPAPTAALGATPDAPAGPPPTVGGASPASAPLPTMAQAGAPGPAPMPPTAGSGAALPQTGPLPPTGGQTSGAGSSLPQAGPMPPPGAQSMALADAMDGSKPAPNAVAAGPAPASSAMADAMSDPAQPMPQFGGSGTNAVPGNSASADPSSAQNFMRSEAARAAATAATPAGVTTSSSPAPSGFMGSLQSLFSPGAPQNGGTGLMRGAPPAGPQGGGQGSPSSGGAPAAPAPAPGGGGQGGGTAPAYTSPAMAPAPSGAAATPSAPTGAGFGGITPEQRQAGMALLTGPNSMYLDPAVKEAITARLFAQPKYETLQNGDLYRLDQTGASAPQLVAHGGKFGATKNGIIYNEGTGLGVDGQPLGGASSYRPMTPAELKSYGITDGRPSYVGPGGEPHFGMPEAQGQGETEEAKKAGSAAADRRNDMIAAANSAPEKIARLKLLGQVLDNTATGPLAPEIGNAGAIATRLGIAPERMAALGIDPNQAVNNAIANKLAGEMTMSSIGAKNGGMPASNFSVAERQFIEALYPNIENQAGGNRAVTDVLTAVEQKKMQWADAWSAYKDQQAATGKPLSYENFEDGFRRAHSQDNIFAPIMARYQAGGYTPTAPNPGGVPSAAPAGSGQAGGQESPAMAPQPAALASQPGGQSGAGYLPGANRSPMVAPSQAGGPAPRNVGPGVTGAPTTGQGDPLSQARAAIAVGAPRAAVIQRLQGMGINAAGL